MLLALLATACVAPPPPPPDPDRRRRPSGGPAEAGAPTRRPVRRTLWEELVGHGDSVPVHLRALDGAREVPLEVDGRRAVLRAGPPADARGLATVVDERGQAHPSLRVSTGGSVRVGGHLHRGDVELRPARGGGLTALVWVPLEDYVEGVVAAELSLWSAQPAELGAQCIAARTYAVTTLARRARERGGAGGVWLEDSVEDQAYHGVYEPGASRGEQDAATRLRRAVAATRGRVLALDDEPLDARFHASCGGHTTRRGDVFPDAPGGPDGVACAPCAARALDEARAESPDPDRPLGWSHTASAADLGRLARRAGVGSRLLRLVPARRDRGGRWLEVELTGNSGTRTVALNELRAALGHTQVKSGRVLSTWPSAGATIEDGLYLRGLGRGHGVGLCQEGARDLANQGWDATRIVRHYYPGTQLVTLPERGGARPS